MVPELSTSVSDSPGIHHSLACVQSDDTDASKPLGRRPFWSHCRQQASEPVVLENTCLKKHFLRYNTNRKNTICNLKTQSSDSFLLLSYLQETGVGKIQLWTQASKAAFTLSLYRLSCLCQESTHSYALWMSYCFIGFKLIFASNMYINK